MAWKPFVIPYSTGEADPAGMFGKVVNFYDSYANALAQTATGLATIRTFDQSNGQVSTSISQSSIDDTGGPTGPSVDVNGNIVVALDDSVGEYFLICSTSGRARQVRRIVVTTAGAALESESSSSESSQEFASYSSSSTLDESTSSESSSSSSSETSSSSSTAAESTSSESSSSKSSEGEVSSSSSSSSGLPA